MRFNAPQKQNIVIGWGFASDPSWGAYDAPSDPLVGWVSASHLYRTSSLLAPPLGASIKVEEPPCLNILPQIGACGYNNVVLYLMCSELGSFK